MRWLLGLVLVLAFASPAFAASAILTWADNSTNELGFAIERKAEVCTGSAAWSALAEVGVNVKSYTDTTVAEGGTYCFRLRAFNTVDGTPTGTRQFSAYSNAAGLTIPFGLPSAAPSQLGVTAGP